jgi:hypothetical protein
VSEVDHARVKLLERVDPGGDVGQGLAVTVTMGVPSKLVGGVLAGGVVTLSRHNGNPVRPVDHQRLMTGGVARRGDERDSWQHFGGAGHLREAPADQLP